MDLTAGQAGPETKRFPGVVIRAALGGAGPGMLRIWLAPRQDGRVEGR